MTMKSRYLLSTAIIAGLALLPAMAGFAEEVPGNVRIAPASSDTVQRFATKLDSEPKT